MDETNYIEQKTNLQSQITHEIKVVNYVSHEFEKANYHQSNYTPHHSSLKEIMD